MDALIAALVGSSMSLEHALQQFGLTEDDMSLDNCQQLDAEIFECTDCEWWYERSEESDEEGVCDDCDSFR